MRNPRLLLGLALLLLPAMVWCGGAEAAAPSAALVQSRTQLAEGEALEAQDDHSAALLAYTRAINARTLPPAEQAHALFERGLVLDQTGRLADAAGDYSAALKLAPGFAPALNNRANVWRRLGRLEDAKRDYLASLAAGNTQTQYPYYGLGQIAEAQNQPQLAKGFYAKAVAADSGYDLAAERLAALGGARQDVIHLHPPHGVRMTSAPLVLRLPAARIARSGVARPRQASLDLRPAIIDSPGSRGNQGGQVQLGAWRSQAQAAQGWSMAMKRAGGALDGVTPRIVPVDLPTGRFYRLRVRTGAPAALCATLKARDQDCLVARD